MSKTQRLVLENGLTATPELIDRLRQHLLPFVEGNPEQRRYKVDRVISGLGLLTGYQIPWMDAVVSPEFHLRTGKNFIRDILPRDGNWQYGFSNQYDRGFDARCCLGCLDTLTVLWKQTAEFLQREDRQENLVPAA